MIHGGIRRTQKIFSGLVLGMTQRNADAGGRIDFAATQQIGDGHFLVQALCRLGCIIGGFQVINDDGKFITSEASNHVAWTHTFFQPAGNSDQQFISHLMPQAVINYLEPIKV